jgi:inner membrane protease subunit 2
MGSRIHLWSIAKMSAAGYVVGLAISDRYVTMVSTRGESMHPTFTASDSALQGTIAASLSTD